MRCRWRYTHAVYRVTSLCTVTVASQYCSNKYRRLVERHSLQWSMSKRGDCYDNACAETFFHSLKVELTQGERYATRTELKAELFQYIEAYYNNVRRHSALNYVNPAAFEQTLVA